jgi:hypothetical protein
MKKTILSLAIVFLFSTSVFAGGALETYDITNAPPSPIAGHLKAKVIGIKWDTRSFPVPYRINNTLNPIPNPLGAAFLSLATAQTELQASLNEWNNIPTSFISMNIVGTTANAGLVRFDMINELTFRTAAGFGAIASSPSVNLIQDTTLVHGDDIDGDGDSDVFNTISVMSDADSDGDHDFPPGFYKAGTILDNDVQFNTKVTNGLRFTVDPAQADAVARSVDLKCVAVHEFGHSFGLSHVLNNQDSNTDGHGATMFPFIDTSDPAAELGQSSPNIDDVAYASYYYPEGSSTSGPAALQAGDIAFSKAYGLIKGELRHGALNQPIAGSSVNSFVHDTNEQGPSAFSGTAFLSFNPANGGLFFIPTVANAIADGNFVIPVPKGSWNVGVEAVDGSPVPAANISFTTQIGNFFGQQNFNEEFWNNSKESDLERRPGQRKMVFVKAGATQSGINITTNRVLSNINNFGPLTSIGFINTPGGFLYAVRFPASQIAAISPGNEIQVTTGLFDTYVVDASVPVVFSEAMLTTGSVDPTTSAITSINLATPLYRASPFVAQDTDFAPMYFPEPQDLGRTVRALTDAGTDVFLVIRGPLATPYAGVSGQPPLLGLNTAGTIFGHSYQSSDGGATWTRRTTLNFRISLVVAAPTN